MPSTFSAETTLFGIGVVFQSHDPEALRRALCIFPQEDSTDPASGQPVHIVLVADEGSVPAVEFSRINGQCLEVVERDITVRADGERRRGSCTFLPAVSSEVFANGINTIVLFLVAQAGRIPLHASAVILRDRALVLAGRSGIGKSALAFAADRAGLPVLSEDCVFVQLRPSLCVWGRADVAYLLQKDAPPEAAGGVRVRSGRAKRAIPLIHRCRKADRTTLFVLTHGERVVFRRLHPDDAVRALTRNPEPGYEFYGAQLEEAIRAVAAEGCWSLSLSTRPDEAIAALMHAFSVPPASGWAIG